MRFSDLSPAFLLKTSIVVALVTIVLKTGAWWVSGSVALLSDALESFVNLAGAVFALSMVTIAKLPADKDHPYGHYKAEYFSSGFEGILIIGASLGIAYVAISRWVSLQALQAIDLGIALSILSSVLNGLLAWVMLQSSRVHRSIALDADAKHLITDVWTSVGVVGGLLLAHWTHWWWLDPLAALLVALNILKEGVRLLWQSVQGLMDEAVDATTQTQIQETLQKALEAYAHAHHECKGISFDHLRTRRAGHVCYLDVHMHLPGHFTLDKAAKIQKEVEFELMQVVPGLKASIQLLPQGVEPLSERLPDHGFES